MSLPWCRHILSFPIKSGRGKGTETCGMDDVFPPEDLSSGPDTIYVYCNILCLYIPSGMPVGHAYL